jgi:hypothetical protein
VSGEVDANDCPEQQINATSSQKHLYHRVVRLQFKQEYRFIIRGMTKSGAGDPNSVDATTLPQHVPNGE